MATLHLESIYANKSAAGDANPLTDSQIPPPSASPLIKPSLNPSSPPMDETLTLTLALLLLLIVPAATSGGDEVHDLLRVHGLPAGLLPKSVTSFSFDPSTGLLEAHLDRPCYAKYDGMAYFDRVVTGNLSYGELNGVVGLKQEELFVWLPVKGVLVNYPSPGVIMIDIGIAKKHLSLSLFEVPPECTPSVEPEPGMISMVSAAVDKGILGRRGGSQMFKY